MVFRTFHYTLRAEHTVLLFPLVFLDGYVSHHHRPPPFQKHSPFCRKKAFSLYGFGSIHIGLIVADKFMGLLFDWCDFDMYEGAIAGLSVFQPEMILSGHKSQRMATDLHLMS